MTSIKRRTLLKGTLAAGAVGMAVGTGLLTPRTVLAAWPKDAFDAKSVDAALNALFGNSTLEGSDKIKIKAPDIAENGAVVPVSVDAGIDGVEAISILAEKNAQPLTSTYQLGPGAEGYVATRIKMGKTSSVIAVVKAGGKLYSTGKEVKVTIGGCGG
ncbi:thiosulfate oxidation carrier protein SoxY [Thiohalobacter sp.]|uniref:thiosulfate oxidation carrier protein SoxY n=1 Tax=Thiohalobacter sp. TaxID=2025948 RepID=UPI00260B29D8|nr:thiosulfate oxidation carrier protein SoxY [Thiohalobacter sp.]